MAKKIIQLSSENLEKKCKERTLILCKPESIVTGIFPDILNRIQKFHYKTPLIKLFKFSEQTILDFYGHVINLWEPKEYIKSTFMKLTENPTLATVVEGPNSIQTMRKIAGGLPKYLFSENGSIFDGFNTPLEPIDSPPGTIRGDYSPTDREISNTSLIPITNFMHASDSEQSYKKEINLLIKHKHISKKDFIEYKRPEWKILFGVD